MFGVGRPAHSTRSGLARPSLSPHAPAFCRFRLNLFAGKSRNLILGHLDFETRGDAHLLCTFFVHTIQAVMHAAFANRRNLPKCKHCQDISSRICLARMMGARKRLTFAGSASNASYDKHP